MTSETESRLTSATVADSQAGDGALRPPSELTAEELRAELELRTRELRALRAEVAALKSSKQERASRWAEFCATQAHMFQEQADVIEKNVERIEHMQRMWAKDCGRIAGAYRKVWIASSNSDGTLDELREIVTVEDSVMSEMRHVQNMNETYLVRRLLAEKHEQTDNNR